MIPNDEHFAERGFFECYSIQNSVSTNKKLDNNMNNFRLVTDCKLRGTGKINDQLQNRICKYYREDKAGQL